MRRAPLTREELLPIKTATVRELSLRNHLALVALRVGQGNANQISELLSTLYLTYFAIDARELATSIDAFLAAELALKECIPHVEKTEGWRPDESQRESIELVLRAHDAMLASTPLHRIEAAKKRVARILEQGTFPSIFALALKSQGRGTV
jgi:hypothetical protein